MPSPSDAYRFIRYEVTRTVQDHQINEIEYFGTVGGQPIRITEIVYNETTGEISLTWTSKEGRSYGIYYDTELDDFGSDVNDDIPADVGDLTSRTFPNPLGGAARLYFRVIENPLN